MRVVSWLQGAHGQICLWADMSQYTGHVTRKGELLKKVATHARVATRLARQLINDVMIAARQAEIIASIAEDTVCGLVSLLQVQVDDSHDSHDSHDGPDGQDELSQVQPVYWWGNHVTPGILDMHWERQAEVAWLPPHTNRLKRNKMAPWKRKVKRVREAARRQVH
jgi:hypothetical protein